MLQKYATFEVLSAVLVPQDATTGQLRALGHRHEFKYDVEPGFLYVRSRAISSRCNDNFDEFSAPEIKKAYKTFIGKPVFVNHSNENHRRARGVVIDAALHEDRNPDGSPDTWVEALMMVDAIRFPKLAQAIIAGHIDRTSMGTDVAYSICSACDNRATSPSEYCQHIPRMKGQRLFRANVKTGKKEGILIREKCYGLGFFENSLLVEEPADPTAHMWGLDTRGLDKTAANVDEHGWYTTKRKEYPKTESECHKDSGNGGTNGHGPWGNDGRCQGCGYSAGDDQDHETWSRDTYGDEGMEKADWLLSQQHTGPTKWSAKQATWIGDHPDEPSLFWRSPNLRHEVHIKNQMPSRDFRENYGVKPSQAVELHEHDINAFQEGNKSRPNIRTVDKDGDLGPGAFGSSKPPAHVMKHVRRAFDQVNQHAQNHADLYGQQAEQDDMEHDQRQVPKDMAAEEKGRRMMENLLQPRPDEEEPDHRNRQGSRKTANSDFPTSKDDRAFYEYMHGQNAQHKEMADHAQKRPVNLADPDDLKSHMFETHGWDESDLWRNSHPADHPKMMAGTDEDRPLTHEEIRGAHEHEHDTLYPDDYKGSITLGDSHFHTASRTSGLMDYARFHTSLIFDAEKKKVKDMDLMERITHYTTQANGKKWNEDNPLDSDNIVAHWAGSSDHEKKTGEHWYPDAHYLSQHVGNDTQTPIHTVAGQLANYSPQTHWATNMTHAATVCRTKVGIGGEGSGVFATDGQREAADRMMQGEHYKDVLKGPKTSAFAHLIHHGGNEDEDNPHVCVDRHALSVAAGSRATDAAYGTSGLGGKAKYQHATDVYHEAARRISKIEGRTITAHHVQATTWLTRQRFNEKHDRELSKTAGSRSAEAAKDAIEKWNEYAGEHHPGLMGKEPGTGYSAKDAPEDVQHAHEIHKTFGMGDPIKLHGSSPYSVAFPVTAAGSKRYYADHPSGYRAEWTGGSRYHIYQGDAPVDSPPIKGYDDRHSSSEVEENANKYTRGHFTRQFNSWVKKNGDEHNDFNHPTDRPSYGDRARMKDLDAYGSKVAFGETVAPTDVDTLRDEECPVCGEQSSSFDGKTCQVCGFDAPPVMFRDPDLEKARNLDLRKDDIDDGAVPGQPGLTPDQQDANGGMPGEVPGSDIPGSDQVLDPGALDENGQPLPGAQPQEDPQQIVQQQMEQLQTGMPLTPDMLGPDGELVLGGPQDEMDPQEEMGPSGPEDPEVPEGVGTPQEPQEPDGPDAVVDPDGLDPEGNPVAPDGQEEEEMPPGAGDPGTPSDGVPDLMCPACGFESDGQQPTSTSMDAQAIPQPGEGDGTMVGDVCPNCQQAQLISVGEMEQMQQMQQGPPV